jgi:pimeloyl-ACP methyl ester carboxylesterase
MRGDQRGIKRFVDCQHTELGRFGMNNPRLPESFATMSVKNILITEPANPILRQMAMRFLQKPDLRLVCFNGEEDGDKENPLQMLFATDQELRFGDCKEIPVDEVWHTTNSADSLEECREKTERALLLARWQKTSFLHYVSTAAVAVLRRKSFQGAIPGSNEQQKHMLNEMAVEQSGCKFRIYRLPLSPEEFFHRTSEWTQFIQHLIDFKIEIEDLIPGYFTAQPLRLCLPEKGSIDIARVEDVAQAMEQIFTNGMEGSYFHIRTQQPLLLNECIHVLAQCAGVRLEIVPDSERQNYVDRLFALRMEKNLTHFECSIQITEVARETASAGQVWFSIPPVSLQGLIAAYDPKLLSVTREIPDWRSGLEQKQVLLPDKGVLNYYVGGRGSKTLVLLNAYGQSFRYWDRFIPEVSQQLRVVLWIPRDNDGDTIGLKVASPQAVHAEDLETVLRQEKIESCTLLAWCSGPKLALEYYQRYPDRISSMLFVAGSFKGLPHHKELETEYEKNLEPLLEAIEKYPETADVVLGYLKGILLAQDKQVRSMDELAAMSDSDLHQALSAVNVSLQELVLHPFYAANIVAYARQMGDFWRHEFVAALDKVDVPVLFVGGDCDRMASQDLARFVAGMMPKARYLEIKGGTHYIHYDQWKLLAEITWQIVNSDGSLEFSPGSAALDTSSAEPITASKA